MSEVEHEMLQVQLKEMILFFENLTQENIGRLSKYYANDAQFKDPFNDVIGIKRIEDIFLHMFRTLKAPKFVVLDVASQGLNTFITWDFHFELEQMPSKGSMLIKGASHLIWTVDALTQEYRIKTHRDYWDAAEELYEKLPLLGILMKWLKKKLSTPL